MTDLLLDTREIRRHRERVAAGLRGELLEIGFGSGLNVAVYPSAVRSVNAVEPSLVARKMSAPRVKRCGIPVDFVGIDGESLSLANDSVDAALSTFTLCTIPNPVQALREIHRVLRPGGEFHFLEHGLSPDPSTARWQHRLNGIERRVAGGCHLDRRIDQLVTAAGLDMQALINEQMRGPRVASPWGYLFFGIAIKRPT
ncbi:MAG: class I SAM-dependent methyltransferase [Candidatus Dormibacter sp.]